MSEEGHVWGVNRQGNVYRWTGSSWEHVDNVPGGAMQISVGYSGVWCISKKQQIFYRVGTYNDANSKGSKVGDCSENLDFHFQLDYLNVVTSVTSSFNR